MGITAARMGVLIGLFMAVGFGGYSLGHRLGTADADRLRAEHAQAQAGAAESARLRERVARLASEAAQAALANTLATQTATTEERRRALPAAASADRPCLREPALRVLDGAPGIRIATDLPEPTGRAAAPGAAAAAPADDAGVVTSEAGAAAWILSAAQAHEACRAQVAALIAWHQATQPPQ